jgi:hypothetical protein
LKKRFDYLPPQYITRGVTPFYGHPSSNMSKSILKPMTTTTPSDLQTPKQPRPLMLPDNTSDVTVNDVEVCVNRTDRKRALVQYESDNSAAVLQSDPKPSTVTFCSSSAIYVFERDDPSMCARMQVPGVEPLITGDLRNSFAARAVDILLNHAQRGGAESVELLGPSYLATTLEGYCKVSSEAMTPQELKTLMLQQLTDLVQRCEARLQDIGSETQFNVRTKMKEMAIDAEYMTEEEEQDYEEALINRKPDVVTQRYLRKRVNSNIVGLDATKDTLYNLQTVLSAPLLVQD